MSIYDFLHLCNEEGATVGIYDCDTGDTVYVTVREAMDKYGIDYEVASFDGYITNNTLVVNIMEV